MRLFHLLEWRKVVEMVLEKLIKMRVERVKKRKEQYEKAMKRVQWSGTFRKSVKRLDIFVADIAGDYRREFAFFLTRATKEFSFSLEVKLLFGIRETFQCPSRLKNTNKKKK
jgi:stalled ribosome alternative rescue factor ArfA